MPLPPLLAAAADPSIGRPLFGHAGLALLAVCAAIACLLAFVALVGRWLAATHPAPPAPAAGPGAQAVKTHEVPEFRPDVGPGVDPELIPVMLAAAAQVLGLQARVVAIRVAAPASVSVPSLEALMQQWSYEGRRQIYSSHKVR
jgi:hypothetical protein